MCNLGPPLIEGCAERWTTQVLCVQYTCRIIHRAQKAAGIELTAGYGNICLNRGVSVVIQLFNKTLKLLKHNCFMQFVCIQLLKWFRSQHIYYSLNLETQIFHTWPIHQKLPHELQNLENDKSFKVLRFCFSRHSASCGWLCLSLMEFLVYLMSASWHPEWALWLEPLGRKQTESPRGMLGKLLNSTGKQSCSPLPRRHVEFSSSCYENGSVLTTLVFTSFLHKIVVIKNYGLYHNKYCN